MAPPGAGLDLPSGDCMEGSSYKRQGSRGTVPGTAKAEIVAAVGRRVDAADRHPQVPRAVVPGPAANHPSLARGGPFTQDVATKRVLTIYVLGPLPDVPDHVVHAVAVRWDRARE